MTQEHEWTMWGFVEGFKAQKPVWVEPDDEVLQGPILTEVGSVHRGRKWERDDALYKRRREGLTYRALAEEFGISRGRAREIVDWKERQLGLKRRGVLDVLESSGGMGREYVQEREPLYGAGEMKDRFGPFERIDFSDVTFYDPGPWPEAGPGVTDAVAWINAPVKVGIGSYGDAPDAWESSGGMA